MELLAVNPMGVIEMILRTNQSVTLEAFRDPFTVDNRQSIVYYVDSNNLMSVNLNILNSAEVGDLICNNVYTH